MEHEKQMNQILLRLESLAETNSNRKFSSNHTLSSNNPTGFQSNAFTLTFTNPDTFEEVKSLKIEWGEKAEDPEEHNADTIIEKLLNRTKKKEKPSSKL
jgi:hypothetical protein